MEMHLPTIHFQGGLQGGYISDLSFIHHVGWAVVSINRQWGFSDHVTENQLCHMHSVHQLKLTPKKSPESSLHGPRVKSSSLILKPLHYRKCPRWNLRRTEAMNLHDSGCPDGQVKLARRWRWGKSATGQVSLGQRDVALTLKDKLPIHQQEFPCPLLRIYQANTTVGVKIWLKKTFNKSHWGPKSWDFSIHWWISNDAHGKQALKKVIHWFTVSHLIAVLHQHKFHFTRVFSLLRILECIFFHNLYVAPQKKKCRNPLECFNARHKNHGQQRTFGRAMLCHGGFFQKFPPRLSKKETFRRRLGELSVLGSWPRPLKSWII